MKSQRGGLYKIQHITTRQTDNSLNECSRSSDEVAGFIRHHLTSRLQYFVLLTRLWCALAPSMGCSTQSWY